MSKLDDLLGKKKEIIPVLDLSKTIAHTKEEYKRLMEKVPDYKTRPIKVNWDYIGAFQIEGAIGLFTEIIFLLFFRFEVMKSKSKTKSSPSKRRKRR